MRNDENFKILSNNIEKQRNSASNKLEYIRQVCCKSIVLGNYLGLSWIFLHFMVPHFVTNSLAYPVKNLQISNTLAFYGNE